MASSEITAGISYETIWATARIAPSSANLLFEPQPPIIRPTADTDEIATTNSALTFVFEGSRPRPQGITAKRNMTGATAFWRAAYGTDVEAMKLLVAYGADPNIRTKKIAGRGRFGDVDREVKDVSGLPPVPVGGPGVTALQAAAGVGYGEGFAANSHRFAPTGMLAAVKYLVEELHVDVNEYDHEGNTALHHAAARGDVEMILYLVSKGADPTVINREGNSTADMANGPVQRTQPYPPARDLLVKLGAVNHGKCVSC